MKVKRPANARQFSDLRLHQQLPIFEILGIVVFSLWKHTLRIWIHVSISVSLMAENNSFDSHG